MASNDNKHIMYLSINVDGYIITVKTGKAYSAFSDPFEVERETFTFESNTSAAVKKVAECLSGIESHYDVPNICMSVNTDHGYPKMEDIFRLNNAIINAIEDNKNIGKRVAPLGIDNNIMYYC